jgi:hypothetical protein
LLPSSDTVRLISAYPNCDRHPPRNRTRRDAAFGGTSIAVQAPSSRHGTSFTSRCRSGTFICADECNAFATALARAGNGGWVVISRFSAVFRILRLSQRILSGSSSCPVHATIPALHHGKFSFCLL